MSRLNVHLPNQIVSGCEEQQEGPIGSESQGFPQCFLPSLLSPKRSANKLKVNRPKASRPIRCGRYYILRRQANVIKKLAKVSS